MKHKKIVSTCEMREIDRRAAEEFGIPRLILMENAGRSVAGTALSMIHAPRSKKLVAIVCGKGNNGGDGMVIARHLMNAGIRVSVFVAALLNELKGDSLTNFRILEKLRADVAFLNRSSANLKSLKHLLNQSHLIVDALFGTGLSKNLEDPFLSIVRLINQSRKPVLAVDIPSGLNGDTGKIMGAAVKARRTVTLGLAKKGLFRGEGPKYTGRVEIGEIGLPLVLSS